MVSHTQILEDSRTYEATSATYGALMSQVRSALDNAIASSSEPLRDVHGVHAEILGYERFLRVSGHHLRLLAFLAQTESVAWRTLSDRLAKLPTWESSEGRWSRAASLLGTAHDLVATHVGANQGLRTAEIEDLAGGPALEATARELVDHLNAAEQAGEQLVGTTVRAQKRSGEHPTTTSHYGVLRSARHSIAVYGRAARWDLREAGHPCVDEHLHGLAAAPLPRFGRSPRFEDSVDALRLLRHLVRAQAHGELPASPISLRDLALLGSRATDPNQLKDVTAESTPVGRLEHAHLHDQLDFAHQSWTRVADHLLAHIQGLTKAPREYAIAIERLSDPLEPVLRRAIVRTLPDLGSYAGDVIRQLALHNSLVSHQREPAALEAHWRPVSAAHREALAELFSSAGAASAGLEFEGGPGLSDDEVAQTVSRTTPRLNRGPAQLSPVQR
jgi:hypothetical protein